MGYILLLLATLAWSFVGILVKTASTMVDSTIITFARFALGIVFLGAFLLIKDRKISLQASMKWIWIGALGKCCNYFFENTALQIGYSYGIILNYPIQTVVLLILSIFLFKEHVSGKAWTAAALCIIGVLFISWNGQTEGIMSGNALTTLLYACSAIGAAVHILSQKMLIQSMDNGNMNFSVFFWCSILMAIPIPWQSEGITGEVTAIAWGALLTLGLITGLSFYLFSEAIRRVPFSAAVIISNSMVIFTIIWAYLFYNEPITPYIIAGTVIFLAGLLLLNLPTRKVTVKAAREM
ncbi:DMT family transporter [Paenibacillus sp. GCM10023252]|uniref:DMT family transporter n=1 Tax=Paenibacillus sp. GCM10023252 TaxID=3252649 RepID=UPI00361C8B69